MPKCDADPISAGEGQSIKQAHLQLRDRTGVLENDSPSPHRYRQRHHPWLIAIVMLSFLGVTHTSVGQSACAEWW
jgi:hypothetical protein